MLRWILAIAVGLTLGLYLTLRPVSAQTGAPDQVSGELLYTLAPEEMAGMLQEMGFAIVQKQDALRWVVLSAKRYTMVLRFVGCQEGRCEGVQVRAVWSLGERPLALAAVKSFERSVAIAQVNLRKGSQGMLLLVGRDIWMLPGRTAANVVAQLAQCDILAASMTQHLRESDPGITAFWEATTPK